MQTASAISAADVVGGFSRRCLKNLSRAGSPRGGGPPFVCATSRCTIGRSAHRGDVRIVCCRDRGNEANVAAAAAVCPAGHNKMTGRIYGSDVEELARAPSNRASAACAMCRGRLGVPRAGLGAWNVSSSRIRQRRSGRDETFAALLVRAVRLELALSHGASRGLRRIVQAPLAQIVARAVGVGAQEGNAFSLDGGLIGEGSSHQSTVKCLNASR
jgi:hypothetical protein